MFTRGRFANIARSIRRKDWKLASIVLIVVVVVAVAVVGVVVVVVRGCIGKFVVVRSRSLLESIQ